MLMLDGFQLLVDMHEIMVLWPGQLRVEALTAATGTTSSITAIQTRGKG
jgi:hypothetical protein